VIEEVPGERLKVGRRTQLDAQCADKSRQGIAVIRSVILGTLADRAVLADVAFVPTTSPEAVGTEEDEADCRIQAAPLDQFLFDGPGQFLSLLIFFFSAPSIGEDMVIHGDADAGKWLGDEATPAAWPPAEGSLKYRSVSVGEEAGEYVSHGIYSLRMST
jgi:hypothetical protein